MHPEFWHIDLPALIIVMLAGMQCALLGSFLILKKQAVMIDAISHSVLPGIVIGAILSGSLFMPAIMTGSVLTALLAVLLVNILKTYAKIEQGAAIGMVFTTFFALGVILLETGVSSRVHLDTQHVLYGALELIYWPELSWRTIPAQIITLSITFLLTLIAITILFKELRLTIFDPEYARNIGLNTFVYNALILTLCALSSVACFEATGSILVIALFVCPAACARLLTNQMHKQLILSTTIALICAMLGYALSVYIGVNAAACIAFVCGLSLIITIFTHKS